MREIEKDEYKSEREGGKPFRYRFALPSAFIPTNVGENLTLTHIVVRISTAPSEYVTL
jgi:hypothetical protein